MNVTVSMYWLIFWQRLNNHHTDKRGCIHVVYCISNACAVNMRECSNQGYKDIVLYNTSAFATSAETLDEKRWDYT